MVRVLAQKKEQSSKIRICIVKWDKFSQVARWMDSGPKAHHSFLRKQEPTYYRNYWTIFSEKRLPNYLINVFLNG